jgi:hypothetical protein
MTDLSAGLDFDINSIAEGACTASAARSFYSEKKHQNE